MSKNQITQKEATDIVTKKKRNYPAFDGNENLKKGDNAKYLQNAMEIYNLPKIDTKDVAQVEERIDWYFEHCIDRDRKPSVQGLSNALGISRKTFYRWSTGESRQETHCPTIEKANGVLAELWEDYMLNGKINPASGIFIGKNHFGYVDNVEITVEPKQTVIEPIKQDELMDIYADKK